MSASDLQTCLHCGSPITDPAAPEGHCCAGCAQVRRLILDCGLGRFYELRPAAMPPVNAANLAAADLAWIDEAQREAESGGRREMRLGLAGISCIGCIWLVERLLLEQPGIRGARVNAQTGTVAVAWDAGARLAPAGEELRRFGYRMSPEDEAAATDDGLGLRLGLCGAFAMNSMLHVLPFYLGMGEQEPISGVFRLIAVGLATLSLLVGGSLFIGRAVAGIRQGQLHMDLPIALGLVSAYAASFVGWWAGLPTLEYWDFVSLFTFLMLVGRWTQERAVAANRRRLPPSAPPVARTPVYATPDAPTPARTTKPEGIQPGDILGVPPGRLAPVSGEIVGSPAEASLAWINGESEPVAFPRGRRLPAGALNIGGGELRLRADETWERSLLRRLRDAGGDGAFEPRELGRILGLYLAVVMILGIGGLAIHGVGTGDWAEALQRMISVMVVSCPCAIGLAFPLATELSVGALRRSGVYVRDSGIWERVRRVRRAVFDKTGTLTLEHPRLANPEALEGLAAEGIAALAALTDGNPHPFARGLREALASRRDLVPSSGHRESTPGLGLTLDTPQGAVWSLGKPGWRGEARGSEGQSSTELSRDGRRVALFRFCEEPRPGAREDLNKLRGKGLEIAILSGDSPAKVSALVARLGLPAASALGSLSPEDKAAWVRGHDGASALMVGDGANDALAFGEAALRGTPVVDLGLLEQKADFFLLGGGLGGVNRLIEITALRRRVLTEVFVFAALYNAVTVALSLAGKMSPLLATLLMPTSAILTVLHVGARLRRA
ncbi:MAG: heavy metal translocating P-type ATPase metal-binding domain-containing protein [Opitutia bacterium]